MAKVNIRLRSFSRSLPMTLLLAREAVMSRFRVSLNLFEITEQQWRVLRAVASVEEIEATKLARATHLLAPSLSRILKDLEARGLVARKRAEGDQRRSRISITDEGRTLMAAVAPYSEATYAEIYEAFGAERMEKLQALLKELTDTLGDLPPVSHEEERAHPGGEASSTWSPA